MSNDPIFVAFRDIWGYFKEIWEWQTKIESRLNELEKKTNIITDIVIKHGKEIEHLEQLEEQAKGKG